ncbi:MAG: MTH938/NDUFAF3 family protein [Thermoplasmata archaeon]
MSSGWIESHSFGKIVIDGVTYRKDIILLGKKAKSDWRRKMGHFLKPEDLGIVLEYQPELLIIGTGSSGRMKVPENVKDRFDFDVEVYETKKACKRYNQALKEGLKIAGAFHLTC